MDITYGRLINMSSARGAGVAPTFIDIICSDCKCKIMSEFLFPFSCTISILMNMQKKPPKARICQECITKKKYHKELELLKKIYCIYDDLQKEIDDFIKILKNEFFKSVALDKVFFNKLIPQHELEAFLQKNQKNKERFKRKSKSFLSNKVDKFTNEYMKSFDEKKVLDEKIFSYKKLFTTNRLIPKQNKDTIVTCKEAKFYDLLENASDEFLPLSLDISIKSQMQEIIIKKFNLLYLNRNH